MDRDRLSDIIKSVSKGAMSVDKALEALKTFPIDDIDFAKVDTHRHLRCGHPEVIFCQGKTPQQVSKIADIILKNGSNLLATRADEKAFKAVKKIARKAVYHPISRIITVRLHDDPPTGGLVIVVSAGTSDIPVAEEAKITAEMMNRPVKSIYDVGVAGIHRLLGRSKEIREAKVVVVVAGMEGALASVVGGLVDKPVIAVPTSVGYGASFGGLAPLLTMLNSCTPNVAVVNIDNGFGAGYLASLISSN